MRDARRRTLRAWCRWGGPVLCAAILTLWTVSRWRLIWVSKLGPFSVRVVAGAVEIGVRPPYLTVGTPRFMCIPMEAIGVDPHLQWWSFRFSSTMQPDKSGAKMRTTSIGFPLWLPLAVIGLPTARLWRLRWRDRFGPGHCRKCGYDLTGLPAPAACPECGRAAS